MLEEHSLDFEWRDIYAAHDLDVIEATVVMVVTVLIY
jgi:hypothetical protein